MADSTKLLLIAGAGGVAWYMGWLAPLGIPGPGTSTPTPTPTIPTPPPGTIVGTPQTPVTPPASPPKLSCTAPLIPSQDGTTCVSPPPKLADLYSKLSALVAPAMAAGTLSLGHHGTPDDYNSFLMQIDPALTPLPDPVPMFAPTGWTRDGATAMTLDGYWGVMSAWLLSNKGMSGWGNRW